MKQFSKKIVLIVCAAFFAFSISAQQNDTLYYKIKQATNKNNQVLLVLLHGMGANEDDLLGLAQFFPDNYTIISPRAPFVLSQGSYRWYESTRINNNRFDGKKEDLDKSQDLIQKLILKTQKNLSVDKSHTIVAGFSQGGILSYQIGLLYPELCKGIGVFSGTLFDSQKEIIAKKHNTTLAIFIGHGDQDNRIPYTLAEESKRWLESNQFKTEFHNYTGVGHSIPQQEIKDFVQFISNTIKK